MYVFADFRAGHTCNLCFWCIYACTNHGVISGVTCDADQLRGVPICARGLRWPALPRRLHVARCISHLTSLGNEFLSPAALCCCVTMTMWQCHGGLRLSWFLC